MFFIRSFTYALSLMILSAFSLDAAQRSAPGFSTEELTFFEKEVRPTLQKNCALCHNDSKRTSGFSVESRESVLRGGNRGPAAVPGNAEQSQLIRAIRFTGELRMPPTGRLPDKEIAVLERWVSLGMPAPSSGEVKKESAAVNPEHWSFRPIQKSAEPNVKNRTWARNAIDRFVLARLEKEGFMPSPEASRTTLIRRLSLDLLGLPPSPTEVSDFLADRRTDAYEQLVDRLLASPHYGERWGRHWLDQARYADSNGYNIDGAREIWMFRDWVINALNRDLPFDHGMFRNVSRTWGASSTTWPLSLRCIQKTSITLRRRFFSIPARRALAGPAWVPG